MIVSTKRSLDTTALSGIVGTSAAKKPRVSCLQVVAYTLGEANRETG
jgi:hypothetical protein